MEQANNHIGTLNSELVSVNKRLQKKLYEFHNIFEVSYSVLGQLEYKDLVRQGLVHILGILSARSALLLLQSDQSKDVFEVVDARGFQRRATPRLVCEA